MAIQFQQADTPANVSGVMNISMINAANERHNIRILNATNQIQPCIKEINVWSLPARW